MVGVLGFLQNFLLIPLSPSACMAAQPVTQPLLQTLVSQMGIHQTLPGQDKRAGGGSPAYRTLSCILGLHPP